MKIIDGSCRLATVPPGGDVFELVRETMSVVPGGRSRGRGVLRRVEVQCHRDELVDGEQCSSCEHLLNAVPTADGKSLRVRCMFLDSDEIDTQMTLACDLYATDDTATLGAAAVRMRERQVKQLVVTAGEAIVGVITRRDTARGSPSEPVAAHARPIIVVPRTMSIAATARTMRVHGHDCVGVIDGHELLGLVTRGDLRRAGVPNV